MLIDADVLRDFTIRIFTTAGASQQRAARVAEHLVEANLKGHDSHGVGMIPTYVRNIKVGHLKPNADATVTRDNGAVLLVDGGAGFGQWVGNQAMDLAINRVRETGVVALGLRNAHHIGRVGDYGEQCGRAGLVSVHFVNVVGHEPLVAPFGGRERRFTTNPFCCVVPRPDQPPMVLDMATSAIAMGKARVAHMKGVPVPEGSLIDADGNATTDPSVMFTSPAGALGPFGAHKGYGLAMMCELLGGALAGEWTAQPGNERAGTVVNNMLAFLLDPRAFGGLDRFESEVRDMVDYVRSTAPAEGIDRVRTPGEPELESMTERNANGIPIDDNSWTDIIGAAEAVGINEFPGAR